MITFDNEISTFIVDCLHLGKSYNQIRFLAKKKFDKRILLYQIREIEKKSNERLYPKCSRNDEKRDDIISFVTLQHNEEETPINEIVKSVEEKFHRKITKRFVQYHAVEKLKKEEPDAEEEIKPLSAFVIDRLDDGYRYSKIQRDAMKRYAVKIPYFKIDAMKKALTSFRRKKGEKIEETSDETKKKKKFVVMKSAVKRLRDRKTQEKSGRISLLKKMLKKSQQNPLKPKKEKVTSQLCGHCGGDPITNYNRGEVVCSNCGLVLYDGIIDTGPEWRVFDMGNQTRVRVGSPTSMAIFDKGLSTDFFPNSGDGKGSPLTAKNRSRFIRWRKWNNRNKVSDSDNRNFSKAFNELERICSQLKLSRSVKEESAMLYRKIRKNDLMSGCSIDGMISACVYAICRMRKMPITQEEVVESSNTTRMGELRNCFKRVTKLNIKIPTVDPTDYIARFGTELELPQYIITKTKRLIEIINKSGICMGKNPYGVTAACLSIISQKFGIKRTQKEFSDTCGITEVTIRQRINRINNHFNIKL